MKRLAALLLAVMYVAMLIVILKVTNPSFEERCRAAGGTPMLQADGWPTDGCSTQIRPEDLP
jgi:hypothetical protein